MIDVDSLAAFKRFLAVPGATLTAIRHDFARTVYRDAAMAEAALQPRRVAKLQTNGVALEMPGGKQSWFDLKSAKAFRFEGGDTVTFVPDPNDIRVIVYRLTVAELARTEQAA